MFAVTPKHARHPMNLESWRHRLRARVFELLRRRTAALAEYRAALEHDPLSARTHHSIAYLLAGEKRYREAEAHFRQALRLTPENANTWFNLGFLHEQRHETTQAIEAFREAVRLDPKNDRAWYGIGLCLGVRGDHAEAAQALQRAAELQPMNGLAWYHLGIAYHALRMADKVADVANQLNRYDRERARELIRNTGRGDLQHLVADMRF